METTHSPVGASSCERWWNCPGSVRLVSTIPPQEPSEYAKEGTAIHELVALALDTKEKAPAWAYVGQKAANGIVWTTEHAEAAQVCVDVVLGDLAKYPGATLEVEKQFQLTHIHPDARGTNDANIGVFLKKLIVYDYKFGRGVSVEVEENKQMMYYGLGANQEGDYDEIELVIIQPRALHRDGPVRRWTLSKSDLLAFGEELREHISKTKDVGAPLVCGDHCQKYFCPALAICPAVKGRVNEVAKGVFENPVRELPSPERLTPPELKKLLDTIPIIDAYIKAVEAFALQTLNNGGSIPGYKLVQKKSNRQWRDEGDVIDQFGKAAYEEVRKVLSPAALENKLAEIMSKKEAKAKVEPFTYKPDAGTTLASEQDPREAVRPKLESVFGNHESDSIFS